LLEGVPRILVRNGVVSDTVLAKEQVTRAELLEALRRQGCTSFSKVRYAFLENDGAISIGRPAGFDLGICSTDARHLLTRLETPSAVPDAELGVYDPNRHRC